MNPLINPYNSLPLLRSYLFDPDRLKKSSIEKIQKYRNKALRRIVKYAYKVPLYRERYKEAGIHPNQIKKIEDITKLPMISKDDMRKNFPDRITPHGNKKNKHVICTGGTTGKSISIYTDFYTIGKAGALFVRELNAFNLTWKKADMAHIGNFNPCRIDLVAEEQFHRYLKPFFSKSNRLNMDVSTPTKELIEKLDTFEPDTILSYPAIFQHLAFLKRKGYGKNVKTKVLYTAGSILDEYTRKYVQDVFNCPLLNSYQSVEAQGPIATECTEGIWHINWDFHNVEAIDDNGEIVAPGERGHILITRLWGRGTPIIRYTGMEDWVRIIPLKKCKCGLTTPVIEGGVEGRKRANIVLPSGKIFPPGAFCFVEPVLTKYKSFMVKQYQIIQKKIDEIEILLVIDEDLRDVGVSADVIKKEIKENYEKKVGPKVNISIKEVDKITNEENPRKPAPIVVTKVKQEEGFNILENKS
ncbi:MAG: phenylacetate--CoA ligase family protein [Atribacterota bacterium]